MQKNYPGNTRPLISRNKREGRYAGFANGFHSRINYKCIMPILPMSCIAKIANLDRKINSQIQSLNYF